MAATPIEPCDVCGTPVVDVHQHKRRAHGIEDTRRTQACAYCGEYFQRDKADQQYCSRGCATRGQLEGGQ